MSICIPALKTKPIPECIGTLNLGKVSYNLLWMQLVIDNITTGAKTIIPFLTSSDGTVSVDLSDSEFSDKHSYSASVTKQDSIGIKETIYLDGEDTKDVELNFERSTAQDGEYFSLPTATLTIA